MLLLEIGEVDVAVESSSQQPMHVTVYLGSPPRGAMTDIGGSRTYTLKNLEYIFQASSRPQEVIQKRSNELSPQVLIKYRNKRDNGHKSCS